MIEIYLYFSDHLKYSLYKYLIANILYKYSLVSEFKRKK